LKAVRLAPLVVGVRLLAVGLRSDEDIDPEFESRRFVDDLVAAVAGLEPLPDLGNRNSCTLTARLLEPDNASTGGSTGLSPDAAVNCSSPPERSVLVAAPFS
jgi:hypothetical protein